MKKKFSMLFITFVFILAFSVTCFAKASPTPTVIPTESTSEEESKPSVSPKTGVDFDLSAAFIVIVATAGIAFVSKKKYTEVNE